MKRFTFIIAEDIHREVKVLAARRNISMTTWLLRAIQSEMKSENYQVIRSLKQETD